MMSAVDLDDLIADIRAAIYTCDSKWGWPAQKALAALEDTLRRAPISAGKVKALEWGEESTFCGQPAFYAETDFGGWMCVAFSGRGGRWAYDDSAGNSSELDWATAVECQVAAQADYEARILSQFEPGDGWQGSESAPFDVPVRVKLGTGMSIIAVLRHDASMREDGQPCDQWHAWHDGEHPACWTDGACWEANADGMTSFQPTHWMPFAALGRPSASLPQGEAQA